MDAEAAQILADGAVKCVGFVCALIAFIAILIFRPF